MEIYNPELGASSMTMSFGAKPKLLFLYQGFAILMGLASMVAALPVAVLSLDATVRPCCSGRFVRYTTHMNSSPGRTTWLSTGSGKKFCGTPETLPRCG